jgi:hypothetical protein
MNSTLRLLVVALVVAAVIPAAGCRKRKVETSQSSAAQAEPMFKIASAPTPAAQLKLLTDAMTTWEDQSGGRALTNLNQLVEGRIIDQLPAPPPGQRFIIDGRRHQVVLVSP